VGVVLNPTIHAATLLLALTASAVQAGRPLATEDADLLDAGRCEWESFGARERTAGSPASTAWATQFGCGVGAATQVALAYSRSREAGLSTSGWAIGGKTGLVERTDGQTGLTLAWGAGAERAPGGSLKHESSFLNLVATREFVPGLTGHANLGWSRSESARANSTTWNLALEQTLGSGVDVMGELYGDDRSTPWLGLGLRWAVTEQLSLNMSWATQHETPRTRLWTVGFKVGF
jgi:hypothetical protein